MFYLPTMKKSYILTEAMNVGKGEGT
jgi:hypothetical protein